jgi:hypothetical protein
MSKLPGEDSIAEKLEHTRWDYTQSDDRRFLLDPIGKFFSTFRWEGAEPGPVVVRSSSDAETGEPSGSESS